MAEVFLAIAVGPEGFQRTVVIKRILPNLAADRAFVQMFVDEAKLCAVLSHPNLVQIFDFGKVGESFFIAMEHVHGQTLSAVQSKLIKAGRRAPIATSLEIVRQVCLGLDYAHALRSATGQPLGIVHRDVSPSNIMLDFNGGVKILDFGIARVAEELRETHTQAGTMKGKVSYMSPEQARLEPVDNRSDIFAVGIVLHELLTGRRLFRGSNDRSGGRSVLDAVVPAPSSADPGVTAAIDRVVMRALERDPDARFRSAGEMASDLGQLLREMRPSPDGPESLLRSLFPYELSRASESQLTVPFAPRSLGDAGSGPSSSSSVRSNAIRTREPPSLSDVDLGVTVSGLGSRSHGARARGKWIVASALLLAATAIAGGMIGLRLHTPSAPASAAAVPIARVPQPAAAPVVVVPAPTVVQVSLDSTPQDAEVTREDTGEVVGRTPVTISLPRGRVAVTFRIEKSGREPIDYRVIPDLDKAVRVDLVATRVAVAQRSPSQRRASLKRAVSTLRSPHPRTAPSADGARGLDQATDCTLSVASLPWAELWIDGRDTGQRTPVVHYALACGAHKLVLRRYDLKLDRSVPIALSAGHELKQHYELGGDYDE